MLVATVLALLVVAGAAVLVPAPIAAAGAVPDEPGVVMLPEVPTYQAVAVDLDGDGAREVVRLVAGDRGSILVEAWREAAGAWEMALRPIEVTPRRPAVGQGDVVYAGTPARLIVRRVEGVDRVTLVRQPRFQEPDLERECCLLLHDLVLHDASLGLRPVADPSDSVGAVTALDLDGDGTDELLVTGSMASLPDIGFPSEARVYRWDGVAFGAPVVTVLRISFGDTPFVLGDSDGVPGVEAGVISRAAGLTVLYRVSLAEDDALRIEDADLFVTDALAVPQGDGRGLAYISPSADLTVLSWPAGERPAPLGQLPINEGRILGLVEIHGTPRLLVQEAGSGEVLVLELPELTPPSDGTVARIPSVARFAVSPARPYVGPLPGGGPDGEPAFIVSGWLLPGDGRGPDSAVRIGTLAGAQPIGLVGAGRSWLALLHAPLPFPPLDPAGGRLDVPILQPGSGVSLAPLALASTPEADHGTLDPPLEGAASLPDGAIAVGAEGFVAVVDAPPGSRIHLGAEDPTTLASVRIVPAAGQVRLSLLPPAGDEERLPRRVSLVVTTPAGHGYVASWLVRVYAAPPPLETSVTTPFGSDAVEVRGRSAPYATVRIAGSELTLDAGGHFATRVPLPPWPTEISVVAVDPLGNTASSTLTGVGLFDYRGLPWLPISVMLVAAAAAVLFLRVPRSRPAEPRAGDDAALEEMDPD
ncbi:MAG TPA: hypothetical protein VMP86_08580 [Candidatus Binatia bacterium]|nr:hypothetical protein [Candidatus Binatia bacterium]